MEPVSSEARNQAMYQFLKKCLLLLLLPKGPKKAAEGEPKEKNIAAKKVAPKKRGRKAAAVAAPNKEEEETEKKPDAKRGRKAVASVEEKREEEAPEVAVPEPEVSSSTR